MKDLVTQEKPQLRGSERSRMHIAKQQESVQGQ